MNGAELIAQERLRQVESEGWSLEHDQLEHSGWELVYAAACYLLNGAGIEGFRGKLNSPDKWPWEERFWKPSPDNRIRELTKAGALIAAEIDRLSAGPTAAAE